MNPRHTEVRRLYQERPKNRTLRISAGVGAALVILSWALGDFRPGELFGSRQAQNLSRFLHDIRPTAAWPHELLVDRGLPAVVQTLAIAMVAMVLAGILGALLAPLGSTALMTTDPFLNRSSSLQSVWRIGAATTRLLGICLRAIPEFIWAFLLLMLLGPTAWPAVIALMLHNAGILGRLGAELLDNSSRSAPAALRAIGASRRALYVSALTPAAFNRGLSLFFYRLETCIREATVLGMLGIASLGFEIQQARAANRYDEMMAMVVLGTILIVAANLCSETVRRGTREWG